MNHAFKNASITQSGDTGSYHSPQLDENGNGIPRGDARRAISRSDIVEIGRNPRRWLRGYRPQQSSSMSWGADIDSLVLTPVQFNATYAVAPTHYESESNVCPKCGSASDSKSCRKCGIDRVATTVRKEWTWASETCKAWRSRQEAAGATVLSAEDYAKRLEAVRVLQECEAVRLLLDNSSKQVALSGTYVVNGVEIPVRALLDIVPNASHEVFGGMLFDLKTSHTADPAKWSRVVIEHSLHVQAAFYLDLYNAATGEKRTDFGHVVQEKFAPFEVMQPFGFLAGDFIAAGRVAYRTALETYADCLPLQKQQWPGYATTEDTVKLPEPLGLFFQRIAPPRWWTLTQPQDIQPNI
jgi:hypothetical protein